MKRISIFLALAASALHAAIVTEQNDLCLYLPDYATFRGTSAAPGIDSCWIPYGTYTGGEGGTEYLRVTSNLVGVVFSAYDGLTEREVRSFDPYKGESYLYWNDYYPSNGTMRVLDWLNHGYYGEDKPIEYWLARVEADDDEWWQPGDGTNLYHRGVVTIFGSRALDALVGEAIIPIPTSWDEALPFRAADSNAWANVFPMFDALQFDSHIWPAQTNETVNPIYERYWLGDLRFAGTWAYPTYWGHILGEDHYDSALELSRVMMRIPLPYTILDVLSVDTGWDADDYAHWNNGTTRLDWKRLGIICQLERQSEITIEPGAQGSLPFISSKARRTETLESEYTVPAFTIPSATDPDTEIDRIDISKLTWNSATNSFTNAVALVGTSFPTARVVPPVLQGSIYSIPMTNEMALCIPDIDLEMYIKNVIEDLAPPKIGGSGSFRIAADWVTVEWSGPRLLVQLNAIYDADDYSLLGYDNTGMMVSFEGTQVAATPITLGKYIVKSSDFAYTRCLAEERSGVISNALEEGVFYYYNLDAGWASKMVASVDMPTWEVMLDAVGTNVFDLATPSVDDGMEWDNLVHRQSTSDCICTRRYRLSSAAVSGTSFARLSSMWLAEMLGLDAAVKERMQDVGGVNVAVPDSQRAVISDDDKRQLDRGFDKSLAVMYGVAEMMPSEDAGARLVATIGFHEGEVVSVDIDDFWWQEWNPPMEVHYFPHTEDGWQLGSLFLYAGSTSTSVDLRSEVPPARVDAHQASILRILWRFKNLRDPNL